MIELFSNRCAVKLLDFFIRNEPDSFSFSDVCRKAELSRATALKWLKRFAENKLLNKERIGGAVFYTLASNNPSLKQYKIFLIVCMLSEALKAEGSDVYLFGSCARGDYKKGSDVDVLVVTAMDRNEIVKRITDASRKMGYEIKPHILNPIEFSQLAVDNPTFYKRIEKEKVKVI